MTDIRTRLELALLIVAVSLFIFFVPFIMGGKQPAIAAAVKQNMDFLQEMSKKYTEKYKRPAPNMEELVRAAREQNYNKTLFNPINKKSGDAFDRKIIEVYSATIAGTIGPDFKGLQYAGKTGYYTDGTHYVIYGHLSNGELLVGNDGKILSLGNY